VSHPAIAAVTFDFFNTLATHRNGRRRGMMVMEYFRAQGWASSPWEHSVLYDVFAAHGHEFAVSLSPGDLRAFTGRVAATLFRRLNVQADPALADAHGVELWRILGPEHLALFPDTDSVLRQLRGSGFRLAVISNWQCGLGAFCDALGFGGHLDAVVVSAEMGAAKPDARIFEEACRQLSLPPGRILHVGDSRGEDVNGAQAAGLEALWLCRGSEQADGPGVIRGLHEVLEYLAVGAATERSAPPRD
jgi:HAD superfamily hydrolase (TIGR01549 family)